MLLFSHTHASLVRVGCVSFFWYREFIVCGVWCVVCVPIQVDPGKYKNMFRALKLTASEDGMRGLARGWFPTLLGYSMQGLCKFGFYEVFKIAYGNMLGEVSARTCAHACTHLHTHTHTHTYKLSYLLYVLYTTFTLASVLGPTLMRVATVPHCHRQPIFIE